MAVSSEDVIGIVAEVLDIPLSQVTHQSQREDFLEWDAVGHMRVCMAIEDRHGIHIDEERIEELSSVASLVSYLKKRKR